MSSESVHFTELRGVTSRAADSGKEGSDISSHTASSILIADPGPPSTYTSPGSSLAGERSNSTSSSSATPGLVRLSSPSPQHLYSSSATPQQDRAQSVFHVSNPPGDTLPGVDQDDLHSMKAEEPLVRTDDVVDQETDMPSQMSHDAAPAETAGAKSSLDNFWSDSEDEETGGNLNGKSKNKDDAKTTKAKSLFTRMSRLKKVQMFDNITSDVVLQYWKQTVQHGKEMGVYKKSPSRQQIKKYVEEIIRNREVENKDKVHEEVNYIIQHFRQRRCKNFSKRKPSFYDKVRKTMWKVGHLIGNNTEYCVCGLARDFHTTESLNKPTTDWKRNTSTELVWPWNFGNVDIPGHYNYLETPGGTRKYLRLDDTTTEPRSVWELLVKHWGFEVPNMVISICGGDIHQLQQDITLYRAFRDGILKTAVKTKAWVLTDGLYTGSSREIADIFQEDLKRSEWAEVEDHANIPLIGFTPWSVLAERADLMGIYVGSEEANYNLNGMKTSTNAMDPYHVCYLFTDNGTSGNYREDSVLRRRFEKFIHTRTTLAVFGTEDVTTPLCVLVVGGDKFTLSKIKFATSEHTKISVVIVNGSGPIANMLADIYKALETRFPRSQRKCHGWSDEEEVVMVEYLQKYVKNDMIQNEQDEVRIRESMKARYLIEVFGLNEGDERKLDRAILQASFGAITEISGQLNLTLALDRVDIAQETIFTEARKHELRECTDLLQNALLIALQSGKTQFANLLIDQDCGGELKFDAFLTTNRLYTLHEANLNPSNIMGKVLRSLCRRDAYGAFVLGASDMLPQIGRIVYQLMGNQYKLLYQHRDFRKLSNERIPYSMSLLDSEEAVWHIFLWAILANKRDIAELFLFESSCKLGCALVAYKLLRGLAKVADTLAESELVQDLNENAEYFQDLAVETLDNLYEFNREEAYACLVAVLPFHWGKYVTPLSIADDAEAMRFMGHACCQTFLNLVWMQYMDLDTSRWKLLPVFAFVPFINIPMIVFDKGNLAFGSYRQQLQEEQAENIVDIDSLMQQNKTKPDAYTVETSDDEEGMTDAVSVDALSVAHSDANGQQPVTKRKLFTKRRLKFSWFCLKNYYTAPINKFIFYLCSYVVFLGLFTHFLLTVLRPVSSASEVTYWEWVIYFWFVCILVEELKQMSLKRSSGPLWELNWTQFDPEWRSTWHWYERLAFVLHFHRIFNWIGDRWNKVDGLMLLMFISSVICRFALDSIDFGVVRIMFSITLIVFYFRILRLGYIMQDIGPRIITIKAMMKDMIQFMLIMSVFLFGFGISFQALLDPNKESSWSLLADVIWRPYWQMYGELMTDDVTTEMDRPIQPRPQCTYNRTLARLEPGREYCYDWMVPVMLGVFMLITNILLLNLLIAIFSQSFGEIEREAVNIWRYHMYDLVHEYYNMVWLPPPLNILCHLWNLAVWILEWPRKWSYQFAVRKHRKAVEQEQKNGSTLFENDKSGKKEKQHMEREVEKRIKQECCFPFYYSPQSQEMENINHFRQEEYMRSEDLEEKAYKRYLRSRGKKAKSDTKLVKMMDVQQQRLQLISSDLHDIKHRNPTASETGIQPATVKVAVTPTASRVRLNSTPEAGGDMGAVKADLQRVQQQMEQVNERMDNMIHSMEPVVAYLKQHVLSHKESK